MRQCHVCQAENLDDAPRCVACNARLRKRERASDDAPDSPFSPRADAINRPIVTAYYIGVWSMVPLLGLILGPLAFFLAWRGHALGKKHPGYLGGGHAMFTMILAGAVTVTQWLGILFIYWSFTSPGS